MDFKAIEINLIEDATIETLKRLFAGLDVDECVPYVRVDEDAVRVRRIEIEDGRLIFVAY